MQSKFWVIFSLATSFLWLLTVNAQKSLISWTSFSLKTREGKVEVDSGKKVTPSPYQSQKRLRTIRIVSACKQASYIHIRHSWCYHFDMPFSARFLLFVNITFLQYDCLDTMVIAHRENSTWGTGKKSNWWNYPQLANSETKIGPQPREGKAKDAILGLRDEFGFPWWFYQKPSTISAAGRWELVLSMLFLPGYVQALNRKLK